MTGAEKKKSAKVTKGPRKRTGERQAKYVNQLQPASALKINRRNLKAEKRVLYKLGTHLRKGKQ